MPTTDGGTPGWSACVLRGAAVVVLSGTVAGAAPVAVLGVAAGGLELDVAGAGIGETDIVRE
ncbi:hypothetical protein [Parafrankia sp. Ea1.12]|uniref:hypothetical protein n=1 Tax=Parafrankia sp. Ea1.12 TaxID=573499 RepID=UPI0011BE3B58|nr:hypothetical protein [Parafrankia sp. Ea1.12]